MAVQQRDQERKLGAVTYQDPDKTEQPISIAGITFVPGDSVNIDELLPEEQANRLKEKLANNPYFKVEGGPDHTKTAEERQKHEAEAELKKQQLAEKKQQPSAIEANRPEQPTLEHGKQQKPAHR